MKKRTYPNIHIFGAHGMLGRYVSEYLKIRHSHVYEYTRKDFDLFDIRYPDLQDYLEQTYGDVVINCAGIIKPRVKDVGVAQTIFVNSVFPHWLANICEIEGSNLIHITTDCVYGGGYGSYIETDTHDAIDLYGRSKSLGEPENCCVIRASVIGEEVGQGRSLVEWAKSNKNKEVNGFMNHLWNGITCLQYAKIVDKIIEEELYWKGVRHLFSPRLVSKCELIELIDDVYGLNMKINAVDSEQRKFMLLRTKYEWPNSDMRPYKFFDILDIKEQLEEMKEFNIVEKCGG